MKCEQCKNDLPERTKVLRVQTGEYRRLTKDLAMFSDKSKRLYFCNKKCLGKWVADQ